MNLCYHIADRIHRFKMRRTTRVDRGCHQGERAYWDWQLETSQDYFTKFFDLHDRLDGADVVDIGCGLGGRTCYLAKFGVSSIVGTDINRDEIRSAGELARRLNDPVIESKIRFEAVGESEGPHSQRRFDVALLVDSLEHVRSPTEMLNLAHSLLKPGGVCYFSTWGWYHHQASHVGSIVPIPFSTVFFSDRQILDAVRRIVDQPYYERSIWDSDPPSLRWQDCQSLHDRPGEYLNKYKIADFRKSARDSDFEDWRFRVQGFTPSRHPFLSRFNFLAKVPVVQEMFHSALFGRLTRCRDSGRATVPFPSESPPLRMAE